MFLTVRLTCALALGAMMLPAQTVPVSSVRTTGMAGLASGQTARFNLLNPALPATAIGVPCAATVAYFDNAGAALKTVTVTVASGKSVSVDLHSDTDLSLANDARREIRATFAIPLVPASTPSSAAVPSCKLIPTLEIFDNLTGRSQIIMTHTVSLD